MRKKKWLWWLLGSLLVIALAVAGSGYYYLEVREYDIADEKVDVITTSTYELPAFIKEASAKEAGGTGSEGSGSERASKDESGTESAGTEVSGTVSSGPEDDEATGDGTTSDEPSSTASESEQSPQEPTVTKSAIVSKYEPVFSDLEAQANAKLNSLVSHAKSEFREKRSAGDNISYGYFYSKYKTAAEQLEASTDAAFQQVYGSLVNELNANGFSASDAAKYKDAYNARKDARRSSLLSQAMNSM
ncbi:hypothetical protein [Aureibacillus halotolerans]|uniref:Uncharacterized protein n=1 Tax=Aureibacillus halotolerans TaxID=1508390 RepID=A0A4R6TVV7_9BACI|nr:hypothetical protein [Aureibacillus halotolerans]TDQ36129.1 hypothetical protein EV213_12060 [Aureibacillus halotolerans]